MRNQTGSLHKPGNLLYQNAGPCRVRWSHGKLVLADRNMVRLSCAKSVSGHCTALRHSIMVKVSNPQSSGMIGKKRSHAEVVDSKEATEQDLPTADAEKACQCARLDVTSEPQAQSHQTARTPKNLVHAPLPAIQSETAATEQVTAGFGAIFVESTFLKQEIFRAQQLRRAFCPTYRARRTEEHSQEKEIVFDKRISCSRGGRE